MEEFLVFLRSRKWYQQSSCSFYSAEFEHQCLLNVAENTNILGSLLQTVYVVVRGACMYKVLAVVALIFHPYFMPGIVLTMCFM